MTAFAESAAVKRDAVARDDVDGLTKILREELQAFCCNIPRELWCQPRWLLWEAISRGKPGKFDKVPWYAVGGRRKGTQGSPEDLAQLVTGDQALAALLANPRFAGIGFAALKGDEYAFLDADRSLDISDEGKPVFRDEEVREFAQLTYCEVSPSGAGTRMVFRGDFTHRSNHQRRLEAFCTSQFVTMTGMALNTMGIADVTPELRTQVDGMTARDGKQADDPPIRADRMLSDQADLNGAAVSLDAIMANQPVDDIDLDAAGRILEAMGNDDLDYTEWLGTLAALNHQFGGSDEALSLALAWSALSSKNDEATTRRKWRSLGKYKSRARTFRSVLALANEKLGVSTVSSLLNSPADLYIGVPKRGPKAVPVAFPAPFRGFMADVCKLALDTALKPQPDLTTLSVLVAMATALDGTVHQPDGLRHNLYGLVIATTGAGKEHLIGVAHAIARAAQAKVLGALASGAGLEDALVSRTPMLATVDEVAHMFEQREGQAGHHMRSVEAMLLKLFTASGRHYTTRSLARSSGTPTTTIANPCVSLLGFAVPTKMGEVLREGDLASGLLGRMLIAIGDGNAEPRVGVLSQFELTEEMRTHIRRVTAGPLVLMDGIKISGEAQARLVELTRALHALEIALPEECAERLLLVRTVEKTKRIAGILAAFDATRGTMTLEHVNWAFDLVTASNAALLAFIQRHMHGGSVQTLAERVKQIAADVLHHGAPGSARPAELAALKRGLVPRRFIQKRLRARKRDLDEAIEYLEDVGDMVRIGHSHKPVAGSNTLVACLGFVL